MQIENSRIERGKELKRLRKSKGVTQVKMAEISGVSLPTIIRMEKGKKNWGIDCELRIRHVLTDMPNSHYMDDGGRWRPINKKATA
jgi:DNA-binding XRE family transcriptional regulator